MHITEALEHIDIHPFDNDSKHDIAALAASEHQRTRKVKQSSYDAHRASKASRRRAVRAGAKPWRRWRWSSRWYTHSDHTFC